MQPADELQLPFCDKKGLNLPKTVPNQRFKPRPERDTARSAFVAWLVLLGLPLAGVVGKRLARRAQLNRESLGAAVVP